MLRHRISLSCSTMGPAHSFIVCQSRPASSQSATKCHYEVLGVKKGASVKDIKAAFYRLSKKYHPDMHNGKSEAEKARGAEMFTEISAAYEVLGSEQKRHLYDLQSKMDGNPGAGPGGSSSFTATQQRHAFREKQFIDLDIDYKDFEHFQRQNRRRQMFDEQLYRSTTYKSFNASQKKRETDQWETHAYANYRSKRAMEREDRERELHSEILKQQQHSRHRTPSLDEMMMHERRNKDYSHITGVSGVVTAIILATLVAFMMESMFRAR